MAVLIKSADVARRDQLVDNLRGEKAKLEDAVSVFNEAVQRELEKLNLVVEDYNAELDHVREFRDTVVGNLGEYIDGKSETWQDGERGQAVSQLKDDWENLTLDDLELFEVEILEVPDAPYEEELESVAVEVE